MIRNERIGDEEEALTSMMEAQQAGLWSALPCIVDTVNFEAQTITAQPAIKGKQTLPDGTVQDLQLPLLVDVPIMFPRAGGFALTFPIKKGDECLVVFSSRCIDSWWQTGGVQPQAEERMHDLSDGFCFLAPTSQPKVLPNVSEDTVQLRDEAGTSFVEITSDGDINSVAVGVNKMSNASGTGIISIDASGEIIIQGTNLEVKAPTHVVFPFTLLHWTKNIGYNHTHPQANDSDGNTEQDTGGVV
jgi:hypothetical protein